MKLGRFKERNNKMIGVVLFTIICILLIGSVILYKTFASFEVNHNFNIINGTIEDIGDLSFVFYTDGEIQKEMPSQDEGYVLDEENSFCEVNGEKDQNIQIALTEDFTVQVRKMSSSRTKCNLYFVKGIFIMGHGVPVVTSGDGLYEVFHNEVKGTLNDPGFSKTEYRYAGNDPNNYVWFNNELWRIIGLVNVMISDSEVEQRVKIIRASSIGNYSWDYKLNGVGSSNSDYGSNDWTKANLMKMLNNDYYYSINGTSNCYMESVQDCNFLDGEVKGLNDLSREMVDDSVIWNLGYGNSDTVSVTDFYKMERGSNSYSDQAIKWNTESSDSNIFHGIGLIYPSDYGYSTSGGADGRESCLSKNLYDPDLNEYYVLDCYQNSWIKPSENDSSYIWTLTSKIDNDFYIFGIAPNLSIYVSHGSTYPLGTYPSLYLKTNVQLVFDSNNGSVNHPYRLVLNKE